MDHTSIFLVIGHRASVIPVGDVEKETALVNLVIRGNLRRVGRARG